LLKENLAVQLREEILSGRIAPGEKIIEGEIAALNQKGEVTIQGSFRAALPSRG